MKKNLVLATAISLIAVLLASSMVLADPAGKVTVCHVEGNGTYSLLDVSESALGSHFAHGDGQPGQPVPGMPGSVFDEACNVVSGPSCPAITAVTTTPGGSDELTTHQVVQLNTPPDNVTSAFGVGEDKVYIFAEYEGPVTGLPLDIGAGPLTGDVCSYYVHSAPGYAARYIGEISFAADITGLIVAGSAYPSRGGPFVGLETLCDTNSVLGAAGVTYDPAAPVEACIGPDDATSDYRGLEVNDRVGPPYERPNTNDAISFSTNTVSYSIRLGPYHDAFRVILPLQ